MSAYQILVIDDRKDSFEEYREALEPEQEWFNLVHVPNGVDALELLKEEDEIDLILLDQDFSSDDVPVEKLFKDEKGFPDRTTQGMLILQELRRVIEDELPIIFCTAYPEAEYGEKAIQLDANAYLEKESLSYEYLMVRIKKFLNIMEYPDLEQVLGKICAGKVTIDPKAKEWLLANAKKRKRLAVEVMTETVQIATKQSVGSSITIDEIMSAFDKAKESYPPEPFSPADYCQFLFEKLESEYTDFEPVRREQDCIILNAETNDGQKVTLRILEPLFTLPTEQIEPIVEDRKRDCKIVGDRALCRTLAIHHILLDQNDPFLGADSLIVTVEEYTDPDEFISLRQYLNRHGEMPANQVSILESQLTSALKALHGEEIYHRHITPEKILMRQNQNEIEFKLSGYAESSFLDLDKRNSAYLPSSSQSARDDDLYALTMVLYEMMTEKLPPESLETEQVLNLLQTELNNQANLPRIITKAPAVNDFEREVFNELKKLPSECVVFRNGVFRSGNSFRECDAVVITSVGMYCIEVKYKAVSNDSDVEYAAEQAQKQVYTFMNLIKGTSWENRFYISPIVVFPDRHEKMTTGGSYTFGGNVGRVNLLSQKTVVDYITAQIARRNPSLTPHEIQQLGDFIDSQATTTDLEPNRDLLYYRIKESWENLGGCKTFKAINERDNNPVVLVEHPVKEHVRQDERENKIKELEHSYHVARRIDHLQSVWQQKDLLILDSRNQLTTSRDGVMCYEAFEPAQYVTLEAFRDDNPNLSTLTKLELISNLTNGLRELHNKAYLAHRSLSLDTVVIAEDKDGKIVPKFRDFRYALLSDFRPPESGFPYLDTEFQAPESVQPSSINKLKEWQSADIYALGVICYYLFFNRMPRVKRKDGRAVKIRRQESNRSKHDISRVVESTVIDRMMNPYPEQRMRAKSLSIHWQKVFNYFDLAYKL